MSKTDGVRLNWECKRCGLMAHWSDRCLYWVFFKLLKLYFCFEIYKFLKRIVINADPVMLMVLLAATRIPALRWSGNDSAKTLSRRKSLVTIVLQRHGSLRKEKINLPRGKLKSRRKGTRKPSNSKTSSESRCWRCGRRPPLAINETLMEIKNDFVVLLDFSSSKSDCFFCNTFFKN